MATKHTPGPWWPNQSTITGSWHVQTMRDSDVENSREIGSDTGAYICCSVGDHTEKRTSGETYEANARLIAAAPELLEACKRALDTRWDAEAQAHAARVDLRAAIAKAEGK